LILLVSFKREIAILSHVSCNAKNVNIWYYLTLCTFSFEINESRLSDIRYLIQYAVSPHCGVKEWCDVARNDLCWTTLSWRHIIGMRGETHWESKQLLNVLSFILCIANSRSYSYFQEHILNISSNWKTKMLLQC
jgi:hypothetical protein